MVPKSKVYSLYVIDVLGASFGTGTGGCGAPSG